MSARAMRTILALAVLTMVAAGCRSLTGETLGENIDDTNITTQVKAKLAAEKAVSLTRVHVQTRQRSVYLTGTVEDPALKERAATIARSITGVRDVINDIKVQR